MKTQENKNSSLIKTLIVIVTFFTYNIIIGSLLSIFGVTNEIALMFIPDIIFLIGILIVYGKTLLNDVKLFHKSRPFGKRIGLILLGFVILFVINMATGIISDLFFPTDTMDGNANAVHSLTSVYMVFKVLIFSVIAEELVFRKSIGEVVENKYAFVIISSVIYSLTNILYSDLASMATWVGVISYFVIYLALSIIYVKNKNNVYPVMLMKFLLNVIPIAILLSEV